MPYFFKVDHSIILNIINRIEELLEIKANNEGD